jgi:hypothetical protein
MLWRLNHELLPDPGSPIARTTTPFEACGRGATEGDAARGASAASASGTVSVVAGAAGVREPPRPRPLPPRLRRRRTGRPASDPEDWAFAGIDCSSPDSSGSGESAAADFGGDGSSRREPSGTGLAVGSLPASKYAGCRGAGPDSAFVSSVFFLRFKRSRIHLRMHGL